MPNEKRSSTIVRVAPCGPVTRSFGGPKRPLGVARTTDGVADQRAIHGCATEILALDDPPSNGVDRHELGGVDTDCRDRDETARREPGEAARPAEPARPGQPPLGLQARDGEEAQLTLAVGDATCFRSGE